MYKALYLLSISLLIKLILYILKDFIDNLPVAESYLIITDKGVDVTGLPITHYALKPEHKDADLVYHVEQFILCNKLSGYLNVYDRYNNFFPPYINLIFYSCYFTSWIYILLKNLLYYFAIL